MGQVLPSSFPRWTPLSDLVPEQPPVPMKDGEGDFSAKV